MPPRASRAKTQAESIRRITGEYRPAATLRTLRIAFIPAFALELLSCPAARPGGATGPAHRWEPPASDPDEGPPACRVRQADSAHRSAGREVGAPGQRHDAAAEQAAPT
ncbi:hypothetical protein [Streptomyces sp. NPDC003015]